MRKKAGISILYKRRTNLRPVHQVLGRVDGQPGEQVESRVHEVVRVVYEHERRVRREAGDDGVEWGGAAHGGCGGVACVWRVGMIADVEVL